MKCMMCGGADLVFGRKKVLFSLGGRKAEAEAEGLHCPECREVVMNREQAQEYQSKIRDLKGSV